MSEFVLNDSLPELFTSCIQRKQDRSTILKRLGTNAYPLELPEDWKISPIFNVEDLTAYLGHHEDEEEETALRLPPATKTKPEIEAIVRDELMSIRTGGFQKFLVKWKGKTESENTWIAATDLQRLDPDLYKQYIAASQFVGAEFSRDGGN